MARRYVIRQDAAPVAPISGIDYRTALNEEQYAAVSSEPGPALVIAGAGSGKTRTLTYRVAWLLEHGTDPWNILLLTFTNILDQSSGGFLQSYYFQIFVCFSIGFIPVDGEGFTSFITQVHVLADGHIGNQRKFLVNDYNSFFFTVFDCIEFTDFTVINDVVFIVSIRINTT